jgi:hypothetical protein
MNEQSSRQQVFYVGVGGSNCATSWRRLAERLSSVQLLDLGPRNFWSDPGARVGFHCGSIGYFNLDADEIARAFETAYIETWGRPIFYGR